MIGRYPASVSGVYYLYKNEEIIYIGQSKNVFARVGSHFSNGMNFDSWRYENVNPDQLRCLEHEAICKYRPKINMLARAAYRLYGHLNENS